MGQRHLDRGTLRRRLHARSRQQRGMQKATAAAQELAQRTSFLLCAVLAQKGGSVTITQGTLDQCMQMVDKIGFGMEPGPVKGEYELRLLFREEGEVAQPEQTPTDSPVVDATIQTPAVPVILPAIAPIIITDIK